MSRGYLWIAVTVLAWSVTYPLIKLALDYMSPFVLLEIRLLVGGSVLLLLSKGLSWGRRQFASGLLNVALFLVLLNLGVEYSYNPALAAVLIYTQPAFLIILGVIAGERISALQAIGTSVAIVGALVSAGSVNFDLGSTLSLLGGFVWALGTMYHRRYLSGENLLKLNAFYSIISAIVDSPLLAFNYYFVPSATGLLLALAVGLLAQALGFVSWFNSIKELGPYLASNVSLLVPALAYVFSYLILGVRPTWDQLIGSAMIIIGVLITNVTSGLRVERELRDRKRGEENNS